MTGINVWILILIVIVLTGILLGGVYWAYRYVFYFSDHRTLEECLNIPDSEQYQTQRKFMRKLLDDMAAEPFEQIFISSYDGKRLAAKYYPGKKDAPVQILMHGYKSNGIRDFCGGSKIGRELGYHIILVDQRAHGKSEGHTLTFGVLERMDCLAWIDYAKKRFGADTSIVLTGLSMGAATVLMASELDLSDNVKGIIADCPYSSPKEIICKVGKDQNLPVRLIYPFIFMGALIFGHFRLTDSSAAEAVKHTKVPILLIHGEDDRFVPCEMSRKIANANPAKIRLETFPEAGHGISYVLDPERYRKVTMEFLKSIV